MLLPPNVQISPILSKGHRITMMCSSVVPCRSPKFIFSTFCGHDRIIITIFTPMFRSNWYEEDSHSIITISKRPQPRRDLAHQRHAMATTFAKACKACLWSEQVKLIPGSPSSDQGNLGFQNIAHVLALSSGCPTTTWTLVNVLPEPLPQRIAATHLSCAHLFR